MVDLIARAARDISRSSYAIALTGAGISTESGIADFVGKGVQLVAKDRQPTVNQITCFFQLDEDDERNGDHCPDSTRPHPPEIGSAEEGQNRHTGRS